MPPKGKLFFIIYSDLAFSGVFDKHHMASIAMRALFMYRIFLWEKNVKFLSH